MFQNFPTDLSYAIGGLDYQNDPIICGGTNTLCSMEQNCTSFVNGSWSSSRLTLTVARSKGSFVFNPNNSGNGRIIFAGGTNREVQNMIV